MKHYLLLFFVILLFSCQDKELVSSNEKESIDGIFQEWNKTDRPGGAVAIVRDGELIYTNGYGSADLEHDLAITPSSVFYIGSVSKQFVTFSVLLLEEQGKLNLDDKIQKYLPDFTEYESPLTLRHFIHHTSGVRDYLTLMYLKGRSYLDHIEEPEVYELIKEQQVLNFPPGSQYLYSNSCYFMLAMIIEKAAGKSLRDFAQENIFDPLGMDNTLFYDDNTDLIKGRAFSYQSKSDGSGFDNLIMRFDLVGSGGIYSTVEDLFLWDQNFYDNKLGKGGQAIIDKMKVEGLLNNGESSGYAFALNIGDYKGLKTVSHGGALGGYRAQLMRFPDQGFSVIILANRDDADPTSKAYEVADLFLQDQFQSSEKSSESVKESNKTSVKLSEEQLEKFAGFYWNSNASYSRQIYLKDDTLRYSRKENNESPLLPVGDNEFSMLEVDEEIRVNFDTNGNQNIMRVIIDDNSVIESVQYEPASYVVGELRDFVGSYWSEELNTNYDLVIKNETLILNVGGKEISAMNPIMKNLFSNDDFGIFEFKMENTDVQGFELMAGRVRNLIFTKE